MRIAQNWSSLLNLSGQAALRRLSLCSFFRSEYELNHFLGLIVKPNIAFIDGIIMGGGAGVSLHGRYRVATER